MIGTSVLIIVGVHCLVPETEKTTADARKITVDDVKRILEVGRLLLSVLTQAEVETLTQFLREDAPPQHAAHAIQHTADESD
jgi:hypothetical protein